MVLRERSVDDAFKQLGDITLYTITPRGGEPDTFAFPVFVVSGSGLLQVIVVQLLAIPCSFQSVVIWILSLVEFLLRRG